MTLETGLVDQIPIFYSFSIKQLIENVKVTEASDNADASLSLQVLLPAIHHGKIVKRIEVMFVLHTQPRKTACAFRHSQLLASEIQGNAVALQHDDIQGAGVDI